MSGRITTAESTAVAVAVSNCAKEPIQIPGAIQDVGMLFVVERRTVRILQVSKNVDTYIGVSADSVLQQIRTVDKLFNIDEDRAKLLCEEGVPFTCEFSHLKKAEEATKTSINKRFLVFVHSRRVSTIYEDNSEQPVDGEFEDEPVVIEVEPYEDVSGESNFSSMENMLFCSNSFSLHLSTADSTQELGSIVAREVQRVSGYDRVMIYAFDQDWNGKVIAEENAPGIPVLYLGHQFPASDIPPQARKLYHINKIRVISDVEYKRSPLVPELNPLSQRSTDLTHSIFRAVSPIHLQYLRNMGVTASFSISIMVDNHLWGLVACHHHHGPKWMSYAVRSLCWSLGHIASLHFSNLLTHHRLVEVKFAKEKLILLERNIQYSKSLDELIPLTTVMLELIGAEYGVIVVDGETRYFGQINKTEYAFLDHTIKWLSDNRPLGMLVTDSIMRTHPDLSHTTGSTSGMLVLPLSHVSSDFIAFFRMEEVMTIPWAGDPGSKPLGYNVDTKLTTLLPRASFQSWTETVRGKSLPWGVSQMDSAEQIQQIVTLFVDAMNADKLHRQIQQHSAQREQLELEKRLVESSNKMKTRFMASVSHELRTPLNAIIGMVELTLSTQLLPEQRDFLQAVQRASDTLLTIITDVLDISKIEEGTMQPANEQFELPQLLMEVAHEHKVAIERKGIQFIYEESPNLPKLVFGDPRRIQQVISNLLGNAEKFTDRGTVHYSSKVTGIEGFMAIILVTVKDTGIGIPEDKVEFVFNAFEQADSSLHRKYAGPGLGLFMSRNLSRHIGGDVWVDSVLGRGSTFYFKFPVRVDISNNNPAYMYSSGSSWYSSASSGRSSGSGKSGSSGSDHHRHRRQSQQPRQYGNTRVDPFGPPPPVLQLPHSHPSQQSPQYQSNLSHAPIHSVSPTPLPSNLTPKAPKQNGYITSSTDTSSLHSHSSNEPYDPNYGFPQPPNNPNNTRKRANSLSHRTHSQQTQFPSPQYHQPMYSHEFQSPFLPPSTQFQPPPFQPAHTQFQSISAPPTFQPHNNQFYYAPTAVDPNEHTEAALMRHSGGIVKHPTHYSMGESSDGNSSGVERDSTTEDIGGTGSWEASDSDDDATLSGPTPLETGLKYSITNGVQESPGLPTPGKGTPKGTPALTPTSSNKDLSIQVKVDNTQMTASNPTSKTTSPANSTPSTPVLGSGSSSSSENEFTPALRESLSLDALTDNPTTPPVYRPLSILVAEDNVMNQKLIFRMLTQLNHSVKVAGNGKECIDMFSAGPHAYDLIIMDVFMPEVDGIQATRWIRENEDGHIPIIALTAQATSHDREACLGCGMDAFVAKPAKLEYLKRIITDVVFHGKREAIDP